MIRLAGSVELPVEFSVPRTLQAYPEVELTESGFLGPISSRRPCKDCETDDSCRPGVARLKRVAYCTFGCRLNQYDTETIRTLLERDGGWQTVGLREEAEVYVVNTCSVTARADATARKAIRRLHAEHPQARILVTGCYAQRAPQEIEQLPGVSLILGAADRADVVRELESVRAGELRRAVSPIGDAVKFLDVSITEMMEHSRAYVKVQEGCNEACTFCIVPQTRGRSR